ncbi:MAG: helix-turn-helix transcriptional regulator [Polyangiales bacterium]|nr:helix-turn-helix transcriptional regulator [Myxococcales bacterium]
MARPRTEPVASYFAANVRKYREALELPQQVVADRMDVDIRYLQRVESGSIDVRLSTIALFAKALDVTPEQLLVRSSPVPKKRGRPKKVGGAKPRAYPRGRE